MAILKDLIVQGSASIVGDLHIGGELKAKEATADSAGLMSAADKAKLDSISMDSSNEAEQNVSSIQNAPGETAVAQVVTTQDSGYGIVEASVNGATSLKLSKNSLRLSSLENSLYIFESNFCKLGSKLIIFNNEGALALNSITGITNIEILSEVTQNITISNDWFTNNNMSELSILVFSSTCEVIIPTETNVIVKYFKNMT